MDMTKTWKKARAALERYHYKDRCAVVLFHDVKDAKTGLTSKREVTVLEGQPCKLSFETLKGAAGSDTATTAAQIVKLFIAPELDIPPGSKIVVECEGRTEAYQRSGKPAVYPSHQELILEPFEEWA